MEYNGCTFVDDCIVRNIKVKCSCPSVCFEHYTEIGLIVNNLGLLLHTLKLQ